MSYLALARKLRPQTFHELIGQEHLTKALENSLNNNRLHHAYLFTGTRGVGKTSVARLLAKALNCEQGVSATPCLKCSACVAFAEGRFIDLIEIDGASKTKVEDTRELLENIQYAPTIGRFKIYLIDEVHMLSQHSCNALLKTLEEPPSHVKFFLATTDPEKLPITILSRCLQFTLRNIPEEIIFEQLKNILINENIQFEENALQILANAANGSMRDSLSLLDQAIVGCKSLINSADVKKLLGYTQQNYAIQIIQSLISRNPQAFFEISKNINSDGGVFIYVVDQILHILHSMAIHLATNNEVATKDNDILRLCNQISAEDIQLLYQIALKGRDDMLIAPTPLIGFEMLLLRMYTFTPLSKQQTYPEVILPEDGSAQISEIEPTTLKDSSEISSKLKYSPETNTTTKQIEITKTNINQHTWSEVILQLNLRGLALTAAENSILSVFENNTYNLISDTSHEALFSKSVINSLETALSKFHQTDIKVKIKLDRTNNSTPAEIKTQIMNDNLKEANESLENDLFFKRLQDEFSAELIKNSIVSLKDNV